MFVSLFLRKERTNKLLGMKIEKFHKLLIHKHTFVNKYVSFKILVDRSKRGFPLKPPDSLATGSSLIGSGLEMVVFDIIYKD